MSDDVEDIGFAIQRDVERLLRNFVYSGRSASHFSEPAFAPAVDLVVGDAFARVIVELAGVPRENVRVRLDGRALEITGRRQPPQEPADSHYHRAEILFGDFHRVVELPWVAAPDRVEALYRDGLLEIRLVPAPVSVETQVPIKHHGIE
jgi:HSP20 family protein